MREEPEVLNTTLGSWLKKTADRLRSAGIETATLDSSLLAAKVLGYTRAQVLAKGDEFLSVAKVQEINDLVDRRLNGWNMAYLLGTKEFMGLEFKVDPRVLVPRPDTEILVEWGLEILKENDQFLNILDLCTGSGAIAASVKNTFPNRIVGASDISLDALSLSRENWQALGLDVVSWESNLLQNIPGTWDLILTNPPYLTPGETQNCLQIQNWKEPGLALNGFGPDGLDLIRALVPQAYKSLNPGGQLLIEAASSQMPLIEHILIENGFRSPIVRNDLENRPRVIGCVKN